MSDRTVVVFDFDLTLTRWETASRFFKGLLRRQPWRIAVLKSDVEDGWPHTHGGVICLPESFVRASARA